MQCIAVCCQNTTTWAFLDGIGVFTEFGAESWGPKARREIPPRKVYLADNSFLGYVTKKKTRLKIENYIEKLREMLPVYGVVPDDWVEMEPDELLEMLTCFPECGLLWPITDRGQIRKVGEIDAGNREKMIGLPTRLFFVRGEPAERMDGWPSWTLGYRIHLMGCPTSRSFAKWLAENSEYVHSIDDLNAVKLAMFGKSRIWHSKDDSGTMFHWEDNGPNYGFYPSLSRTAESIVSTAKMGRSDV